MIEPQSAYDFAGGAVAAIPPAAVLLMCVLLHKGKIPPMAGGAKREHKKRWLNYSK